MKALATFIMRGPSSAALVAASAALLSMLVPLLGILAAAVVALVTLRAGARSGALVILIASLGAGVFFALALGSPWPVLAVALLSWLPLWFMALALRLSRSLALGLELAAGGIALALIAVYGLIGEPAAHWRELLDLMGNGPLAGALAPGAQTEAILAQLARWMTGALAAALLVQFCLALFVARWWQALLYNPGGFGTEFRALRLHRPLAILAVVFLGALGLAPGAGLHTDLLLVLAVLFAFQGLAVAHGLRALGRVGAGWLIATYALLLVLLPQTAVLLAVTGLVDVWVDFRARAARLPPRGS